MELKRSAYRAGSAIPVRYTCDGDNISPAMAWKGVPARTKTFALILHDPDAPSRGGFTHWVIYNMDAKLNQLGENIPRQGMLPGWECKAKTTPAKLGTWARARLQGLTDMLPRSSRWIQCPV